VLRAAGETETMQENIQDWLQLDEGHPGFQLLTEEEIAAVIFFIFFHEHYLYYYTFYLFLLSFRAIPCFINQDYQLIQMTSPPI
jgi:hypothetical protein